MEQSITEVQSTMSIIIILYNVTIIIVHWQCHCYASHEARATPIDTRAMTVSILTFCTQKIIMNQRRKQREGGERRGREGDLIFGIWRARSQEMRRCGSATPLVPQLCSESLHFLLEILILCERHRGIIG